GGAVHSLSAQSTEEARTGAGTGDQSRRCSAAQVLSEHGTVVVVGVAPPAGHPPEQHEPAGHGGGHCGQVHPSGRSGPEDQQQHGEDRPAEGHQPRQRRQRVGRPDRWRFRRRVPLVLLLGHVVVPRTGRSGAGAAAGQVADAGWVCERRRRRWRVLRGARTWLRGARGASLAGRGGPRAVAGDRSTRAAGALGSTFLVRLVSRTGSAAAAVAVVTQILAEAGQVRQPGGDLRPLALDVSVRGLAAPRTPLALVGTSTGHGATVRRTATLVVPV